MLSLEPLGDQARIRELVVGWFVEADGEGLDGTVVNTAHQGHDGAGVHPPAEEYPQRNV